MTALPGVNILCSESANCGDPSCRRSRTHDVAVTALSTASFGSGSLVPASGSVFVPMSVVRGVTMMVVNVVVVVEVAHHFVTATGPVNVGMICVDDMSFEEALVPVVPVGMVDMSFVQVVGMVAVWHGDVPTTSRRACARARYGLRGSCWSWDSALLLVRSRPFS